MRNRYDYPDDLFSDSRMSFGDHIEELRTRLLNALKGLAFCMVIGFVLDGIGTQLELPWLGIGKPVLAIIQKPVEDAMKNFYNERVWKEMETLRDIEQRSNPDAVPQTPREREAAKEKFLEGRRILSYDNTVEGTEQVNSHKTIEIRFNREDLAKKIQENTKGDIVANIEIRPLQLAIAISEANSRIGKSLALSTLSAQESFVVYIKVSLLCGFILASPWVFWQFWAFVGAGLYPHERQYVNKYLPFSIALFLAGIFLCFIWVLPGTVKGLLSFNSWLGQDPDLRLNDWLNLALILPLVFGLSFQTPLLMLALNQLGIFSPEAYLSKWRHAILILTIFAIVVTPTPDVLTMSYLLIPMLALYFLGILLCKMFPQRSWLKSEIDGTEAGGDIAV